MTLNELCREGRWRKSPSMCEQDDSTLSIASVTALKRNSFENLTKSPNFGDRLSNLSEMEFPRKIKDYIYAKHIDGVQR